LHRAPRWAHRGVAHWGPGRGLERWKPWALASREPIEASSPEVGRANPVHRIIHDPPAPRLARQRDRRSLGDPARDRFFGYSLSSSKGWSQGSSLRKISLPSSKAIGVGILGLYPQVRSGPRVKRWGRSRCYLQTMLSASQLSALSRAPPGFQRGEPTRGRNGLAAA
jgi:hypothetical protein